jgi:hypothetical protein
MNELLHWMSAKGMGSAMAFRLKVSELGAADPPRHKWVEWNLAKLGHAEFEPSADGAGWRVAPPILAAGDFSSPCRAVLCGARTPKILGRLGTSTVVGELSSVDHRNAPDTIEVVANDPRRMCEIAEAAGLSVQWNTSLALLSVAIAPKEADLKPIGRPIGGWTVRRYSKSNLAWVASSTKEATNALSGLFHFRSDYGSQYMVVEDGRSYECDAAVGKYRILQRRHRALRYEAKARTLLVPTSCRPPDTIEKALVLCSGRLPTFEDGLLGYTQIAVPVARAAAAVLEQRLV